MDIVSHGLWSLVLFKSINLKLKSKKFNLWNAAFWGIFPDLFTFVIPYLIWIFQMIFENTPLLDSIKIGATSSDFPYYHLVEILYNISHSIIIFIIIFCVAWLLFKKPIWILCGWLLHILFDIFTHIEGHFPTPILWPLSNFKFNGLIYWRNTWFIIIEIALLIVVYFIIYTAENKKKN